MDKALFPFLGRNSYTSVKHLPTNITVSTLGGIHYNGIDEAVQLVCRHPLRRDITLILLSTYTALFNPLILKYFTKVDKLFTDEENEAQRSVAKFPRISQLLSSGTGNKNLLFLPFSSGLNPWTLIS